jgi:hypothetical protein
MDKYRDLSRYWETLLKADQHDHDRILYSLLFSSRSKAAETINKNRSLRTSVPSPYDQPISCFIRRAVPTDSPIDLIKMKTQTLISLVAFFGATLTAAAPVAVAQPEVEAQATYGGAPTYGRRDAQTTYGGVPTYGGGRRDATPEADAQATYGGVPTYGGRRREAAPEADLEV